MSTSQGYFKIQKCFIDLTNYLILQLCPKLENRKGWKYKIHLVALLSLSGNTPVPLGEVLVFQFIVRKFQKNILEYVL